MTSEQKSNPPTKSLVLPPPIILNPWIVVGGTLVLYLVTLNHWVSLRSLPVVAQVTGWDWQPFPVSWRPEFMQPLFILLTAPIRILPVGWQPLALNIFTAACAALTLGLLARSVRLFPQDRTREQLLREPSHSGLLTLKSTFVPALFAVLLLAFHLTFWENSIAATGEIVNVLVLAFVINCLLEFRQGRSDKWMFISAFAYGLGATNDWAFIGFFPLYLITVLWIRGFVGFFNVRFLVRMTLCGLAGLLLYLLLPLMAVLKNHLDFWAVLHMEFGSQSYGLHSLPRYLIMVAAVPTLIPVLFASIKWPRVPGEVSAAGDALTRLLFTLIHVALLVLVLATFFEFKYSPSLRIREFGHTFLTFYYLGALAAGYYTGYMLLVFGKPRIKTWEKRNAIQGAVYPVLYGVAWVLAFGCPVALAWQSFPRIHAANGEALREFADKTVDCLPPKQAVIMSDDLVRLFLVQADLERRGLKNDHFLIETEAFPHRDYVMNLAARYPGLAKLMAPDLSVLPKVLSSGNLMSFVYQLTQNYSVYYLHPSFGYYFEAMYLHPSGLVYQMRPFTTNTVLPPVADAQEIQTNEAFWAKFKDGFLKDLPSLAEKSTDCSAVCVDCSVALDFWGTELQKADRLKEAHAQFAEAVRLETNNFIAGVNLQYNEQLQKGDHSPINFGDGLFKATMAFHGLNGLLRGNGPPDEPNLDLALGEIMAKNRNLRQAMCLFERRLQLLPGDPDAEIDLALSYIDRGQPDKALDLLIKVKASGKFDAGRLKEIEALAYAAKRDAPMAEKLLKESIQADPNDVKRLDTLTEFYRREGLEFVRAGKQGEANQSFSNALTIIEKQLQVISSPSHDAATADLPVVLLKKAEIQTQLHAYSNAVDTLSRTLEVEPRNYTALLNRALAEIKLKQFDQAKEDFTEIGKILPKETYLTEFGLAEVAEAEDKRSDAIDHLKRGIKSAPEESPDYRNATNRLALLEKK